MGDSVRLSFTQVLKELEETKKDNIFLRGAIREIWERCQAMEFELQGVEISRIERAISALKTENAELRKQIREGVKT